MALPIANLAIDAREGQTAPDKTCRRQFRWREAGWKTVHRAFRCSEGGGARLRQASCARLEEPENFPVALRTAGGPQSILSGGVTPAERVPARNAARRASGPATVHTKCCSGGLWRREGSSDFARRASGVQRTPCKLTGDPPAGERTPCKVLRVGFYRTEARSEDRRDMLTGCYRGSRSFNLRERPTRRPMRILTKIRSTPKHGPAGGARRRLGRRPGRGRPRDVPGPHPRSGPCPQCRAPGCGKDARGLDKVRESEVGSAVGHPEPRSLPGERGSGSPQSTFAPSHKEQCPAK
jgi:hypothetical protein